MPGKWDGRSRIPNDKYKNNWNVIWNNKPKKKKKKMIPKDEALEISMKESIRAKNERLAKEKGMIRLFTPKEEDIMRKGFEDIDEDKNINNSKDKSL